MGILLSGFLVVRPGACLTCRKIAYESMQQDIANILSMLCKRKGVNIVEAKVCPDHIHMLVEIPPSMSVSSFVGY